MLRRSASAAAINSPIEHTLIVSVMAAAGGRLEKGLLIHAISARKSNLEPCTSLSGDVMMKIEYTFGSIYFATWTSLAKWKGNRKANSNNRRRAATGVGERIQRENVLQHSTVCRDTTL